MTLILGHAQQDLTRVDHGMNCAGHSPHQTHVQRLKLQRRMDVVLMDVGDVLSQPADTKPKNVHIWSKLAQPYHFTQTLK